MIAIRICGVRFSYFGMKLLDKVDVFLCSIWGNVWFEEFIDYLRVAATMSPKRTYDIGSDQNSLAKG